MTSAERMYAVYTATRHIVRAGVQGAVVECGVWRGGSSMMTALTLNNYGDTSRPLYLFDTFAGMSEPTEHDRRYDGQDAHDRWARAQRDGANEWCHASEDDVRLNMRLTGYDGNCLNFVRGKVEETIPDEAPQDIALLRLDTDWYQSTRHELEHLYPRLALGGVLIVDDYGHWSGARQAIDEYFVGGASDEPNRLHR